MSARKRISILLLFVSMLALLVLGSALISELEGDALIWADLALYLVVIVLGAFYARFVVHVVLYIASLVS